MCVKSTCTASCNCMQYQTFNPSSVRVAAIAKIRVPTGSLIYKACTSVDMLKAESVGGARGGLIHR